MKRRAFIRNTTLAGLSGILFPGTSYASLNNLPHPPKGELLYNGIRLPDIWPPTYMKSDAYRPMPVPYLENRPEVIPINIGRQLFVDDFLIESTDLKRKMYKARKIDLNPIFKPETDLEQGLYGIPGASPKDGGVWWDPEEKLFKMWYEAGWLHSMAYATSKDGIHWERPGLDIEPGTNRLLPDLVADSTTVWLDHFTDNLNERFKMFFRCPNAIPDVEEHFNYGYCMTSPDGIHWSKPLKTGFCGDRSTIFYNPFRKKWIYSIRNTGELGRSPIGRSRYYHEHSDFLKGCQWDSKDPVFWTGADDMDIPDPYIGEKPQLYNLSAVGYESILLGLHQIHHGPTNERCLEFGVPKITELMVSYSRDGFHWDRPDREAFIPSERKHGFWDRGYVQSVGGICTVVGDQLRFYYIGYKGDQTKLSSTYVMNGMHSFGSTGIAVLRRDGFASMCADKKGGVLTTRPLSFDGSDLFVNVNCPNGQLKVEILDQDNTVIKPFTQINNVPVSVDSTIQQVIWKGTENLSVLKNRKIRFRFYLNNGELYAFWVSPDQSGASRGFNAAGGPGFNAGIDQEGKSAYQQAVKYPKL
ncbi:MAG: glycosyl hydrolase family 32 [Tannerella sp.]|nr:glycosyl hydrolase family 32 [Tannerella sp.]